jgi:hypothetical protein
MIMKKIKKNTLTPNKKQYNLKNNNLLITGSLKIINKIKANEVLYD